MLYMKKIKIYEDIENIMAYKTMPSVKNSKEYLIHYEIIQNALYNGENFEIVVRSRYWLKCFEKMQNLYGDEYIEICTFSPKKQISDVLNIVIPDYINENDIIQSKILNTCHDLQISSGMSFEDIIISNYLSAFLVAEKFPCNNLLNILNNLDFNKFKENISRDMVSKVYKNKLEHWIRNSSNESECNILNKFSDNPEAVYKEIYQYILLKGYPKNMIIDILGGIGYDYIKIDIKGQPRKDPKIEIGNIKDKIRIFFNSLKQDNLNRENILDILRMTSGILAEELNFIIGLLKNNISVVDREVVNRVKFKFNDIIKDNSEYEELLENIIPPPIPKMIKKETLLEDKIKWSKNEYLPYRFWMEDNNQIDEIVDELSNQFGEWIYENYSNLLSKGENMIFNAINSIKDSLKNDELSIVLIIDNFNYKYVHVLKQLFLEQNFSNTMDKPLLSMVPSETAVSKAALIRGDAFDYNNKSYDKLCNEWKVFLNKSIKYLSGIGQLRVEVNKGADIYFINYLEIDSILHSNQKNFAQSTKSKVKEELKALVNVLISFINNLGLENKAKIYVCSDHGCTKIITDKENHISKSYYKGKCDDASHRFVTISDENMNKLSNNIDEFCYVIDKSTYGTKENYLIAKNYYRFLETNENFYVHGGITPEEVIVPFLKFERVNINIKYPLITVEQNEFRISVKTSFNFKISNVNEYEITNIEINILNSNILGEMKKVYIENIGKLETKDCMFKNMRINKDNNIGTIVLRIKFEMLERKYGKDYDIPIIIKSMMENKMNFDDLF